MSANNNSAQPCGCDEGAKHLCLRHQRMDAYTLAREKADEANEADLEQCLQTPLSVIGPTRASTLPADAKGRKQHPVASGVLDYFPDALVAIAHVSYLGNEQHNPGQPLHWAREKSTDQSDTIIRHFLERGTMDSDGVRHSAKMAWRALALLQLEIEKDKA